MGHGQGREVKLRGRQTLLGRGSGDAASLSPHVKDVGGEVTITVVGEQVPNCMAPTGAILDRYPGCGPMGGMEAALAGSRTRA